MEPWHFSHGEVDNQGIPVMLVVVLQWSHGILAMERTLFGKIGSLYDALQWSHGILAMERVSDRINCQNNRHYCTKDLAHLANPAGKVDIHASLDPLLQSLTHCRPRL